jgi:hypothetical protein
VEENLQRLREQIINLNNSDEFKQLSRYYKKKSFFNILGISRKESIHNYFLHWLFSHDESHELGDFAIRRLLELIVLVKNKLQFQNEQLKFPDGIEDIIICGGYTIDRIECDRERVATQNDRLDLFLSFDFSSDQIEKQMNIILENKVKSKEGKEQTARYYQYGEGLDGETVYLFLSPLSNSDYEALIQPVCECKKFIGLNYQYMVDYVLEPCLSECIVTDAKIFIEEYLRTLSQPSLQFDDFDGGDVIMAVSSREKELLLNFWENNKDLLTAAFNALADNPDLEQEERDRIRGSLQAVSKAGNQTDEFRKWIRTMLEESKARGDEYLDIVAGDIIRDRLRANYKKTAQVCSAMKSIMREGDIVLKSPPSGLGSTLTIRYSFLNTNGS